MPLLLSDAPTETSKWAVSAPKTKNGQMAISSITGPNGWPSLQLLPKERLGEILTPFEPSVYRGTGSEPRKGIVFAVPPDVFEDLEKIDKWAQSQRQEQGVWHSCLKPAGTYSASVKAKINVTGPNKCNVVDMHGKPAPWPGAWARLKLISILEVRGIYSQKTGSGLILEVTHLMLGEPEADASCAFL